MELFQKHSGRIYFTKLKCHILFINMVTVDHLTMWHGGDTG